MATAHNTPFKVALDWTPNVNHAGFFVAQARGLYAARGLDVEFLSPSADNYKQTPAQKLASGAVQLAICPSETVISYSTKELKEEGERLVAVAAVLAEDTSAIVTLQASGIARPAQLDGKVYASYGARYEGRIVQQLIRNDGGSGSYTEDADLPMLGIWDTLLAGKADATWVFMGWEGIIAQQKGVPLNAFMLADSKIPYGYSPLLVASQDGIQANSEHMREFLLASAEGWKAVASEPRAAAAEAVKAIEHAFGAGETPDAEVMALACEYIASRVIPENGIWGSMQETRWSAFLDWLSESGLLTSELQSRTPVKGVSMTLDALREGQSTTVLPRDSVTAGDLFNNALLT